MNASILPTAKNMFPATVKKIGFVLLSCVLSTLLLSTSAHAIATFQVKEIKVVGATAGISLTYQSDSAGTVYIQLGRPSSSGTGSTCIPESSLLSKEKYLVPTELYPQNNTLSEVFGDLSGQYCIQIVGPLVGASTQHPKIIENLTTFSTDGTSIGNGTPTEPTNLSNCESTDNSSYCLLAPLPGIGDSTGKVDVTNGLQGYINGIIRLVIGLIGVLAVVMIVVGGIEYMSTVSVGEKEGAKSRITNAVFGLILALSAYTILNTINPNLVNLSIYIPNIELTIDENVFVPTSGGGTYTGGGSNPNVTTNITTYDALLKTSAEKYGIQCTLVKAFMYAESGGNPNASSGAGAKGLIQLMPATFKGLGYDISKILDPATNIDAGAKYISNLRSTACNGKTSNSVCSVTSSVTNQYLIAAYNGGPKANSVSKTCPGKTWWECPANSGYAETRNYVPKVQGNYEKLKANNWGC